MAFLLQTGADPAERQGLILSAWEAERQFYLPRRRKLPAPDPRRRPPP